MNLLALTVGGYGIGQILLFFVGLVLACAIVYAIMKACGAPPWLYTVAWIAGLVVLLIIVIAIFFPRDGGPLIR